MQQTNKDEEVKPTLPVLANGCISKSSLRQLFFNDSRMYYLQTITVMCQSDVVFKIDYAPFINKKLLPKKMAIAILAHNQWEVDKDYTLSKA